MRIAQIELRGFRGAKSGCVVLPRHAVLLGANDVGKSTLAEALALVAGKERLTRPLCDWDFFGGDPTPSSRSATVALLETDANSILVRAPEVGRPPSTRPRPHRMR